MDFLKKNKALAIGIGVALLLIIILLSRGKKTTKASSSEKTASSSRTSRRRYRGSRRRGRSSLRKKTSRRSSRSSRRGRRGRSKSKKEPAKAKKKVKKINYNLTIADIPSVNNKELIEKRIKGELIKSYDYTYLYNPYEDWLERIYMQDTDGDGIPDNKDPDIDDDGFSNEEEIKAGTDPYDYRSHPKVKKKKTEENKKEVKAEKKKEEKKLTPEERKQLKLKEEEKKWNAIVKNYSYKGTFGLKYQRIAIFKDANSGEVILRKKGDTIPGTKMLIYDVTDKSVVLKNMETGNKKEIFAAEPKTTTPSVSANSTTSQGINTAPVPQTNPAAKEQQSALQTQSTSNSKTAK